MTLLMNYNIKYKIIYNYQYFNNNNDKPIMEIKNMDKYKIKIVEGNLGPRP